MKKYIASAAVVGLLVGCGGSPEPQKRMTMAEFMSFKQKIENSKKEVSTNKTVEQQYLQDSKQFGFNYPPESPEYIAYEYNFNSVYKKNKELINNIDEQLKSKWAKEIKQAMEIVYKYKYFETSYNLFGDYRNLNEIKQMSNDELVLAYLKAEIIRNYILPPAVKTNIETKTLSNTKKEVTLNMKIFFPMENKWIDSKNKVIVEKKDDKWTIVDSEIVKELNKSLSKEVRQCKKQDLEYTQSYEQLIEKLNKNICNSRAKTSNKNNGFKAMIDGPLNAMVASPTVIERNFLFGSNNGNCMALFNTKDYDDNKVDELILPFGTCTKEINEYVQVGPSSRGFNQFYFNNGSLACRKDGEKEDTIISKKAGWSDWQPTKEFIQSDYNLKRFKFNECRDIEK